MTTSVTRLRSPSGTISQPAKRAKTAHLPSEVSLDPTPFFADDLFNVAFQEGLNTSYKHSEPYKHAVIDKLFQDDLLEQVKDECLGQLSFTEKETDIYKVNQTGDLASLSYLTEEQVASLPSLLKLRDALYSEKFRTFVRNVTSCGPLSGIKQDMSVNSYKKGCHLLNHDDVIGSRRVSYILYMPLPRTQPWKRDWGGALELYPVKPNTEGINEPESIPSKIIPPSWNQFVFFEVQPGHSFHSVEEVTIDEGDCDRQRLSISGWFHSAQEGEDGYEVEKSDEITKSSLEQLTSTSTPLESYDDGDQNPPLPIDELPEEHIEFLSKYLNPVYLKNELHSQLSKRFVLESSLELHDFLAEGVAGRLLQGLRARDAQDGLDVTSRKGLIAPHNVGVLHSNSTAWTIRGPPHKARYCVLALPDSSISSNTDFSSPETTAETILKSLQDDLFPSPAFRAWLARVAYFIPMAHAAEARRFRPGLDYTLATGNEEETRLDVVLGLTPPAEIFKSSGKGKGKGKVSDEPEGWEAGEWGGWECYMAQHEGDDDPAVYRSGSSKSKPVIDDEKAGDAMDESKESTDEDVDEDDEEDGTLLTVQPGFNRLLLVLRDEGVMRFVKYVSASAPGSRWDVCGEYGVAGLEIEGEEGEDGDVSE